MDSIHEEWRVIPECPNYQASNLGRINSIPRYVRCVRQNGVEGQRWCPGGVLTPVLHKGYHVTKLGKCKTLWGYHQLVARAWIGPQESGMVVNHKNGIKTDNRPENLEYITSSENVYHAHRTGLMKGVQSKGESHCHAKLTENNVREVLTSSADDKTLAKKFACTAGAIHAIRIGKNWKHVSRT